MVLNALLEQENEHVVKTNVLMKGIEDIEYTEKSCINEKKYIRYHVQSEIV